MKNDFFFKESGTVRMGGARGGVRGRGCAFFPPFALICIPALRTRVCCGSHEWRRRFRCWETEYVYLHH